MNSQHKLLRSWIFVPGSRQRMIDKALGFNADALMFDIEDGVAPDEKETARAQIAAVLDKCAGEIDAGSLVACPARFVRVNAIGSERIKDDLSAAVRPGCDGLVLPKVDQPEEVSTLEAAVAALENERGMAAGALPLLPSIESPIGLFNAYAIATSSPRIIGLILGTEDFCRGMGLPLKREGQARDLIFARSTMATAAAAAHVQAVDGIWPHLEDGEGLKRYARQARELGMSGMSLLHPSQIDAANAAFSPSSEDVQYAEQVLKVFEEAEASGLGAIAFRGQFLDLAIINRARQTLVLGKSLGIGSGKDGKKT
ncbi:MAG: CoA ester lyase [Micropepsaceae bacterium]